MEALEFLTDLVQPRLFPTEPVRLLLVFLTELLREVATTTTSTRVTLLLSRRVQVFQLVQIALLRVILVLSLPTLMLPPGLKSTPSRHPSPALRSFRAPRPSRTPLQPTLVKFLNTAQLS